MFKVANNMKGLLFVNRYYNTRNLYINGANPIRDRVMSTPTWPVPYYQRIVKAYPIRCKSPTMQRKQNPTSEVQTCLLMKLHGFSLSPSSMNRPKDGRLSATPSKISRPTVRMVLVSLSHQERWLRDHGPRLRQRYQPVFGPDQQRKHPNPQG